ncbi:DUF3828 domain-containing protein [Methylobacterium brachythecii]|uniref:DUF3828 domain-containing protein n=1 Tax=Methylobacterium brachythecii TaxID=1176177 RepID=A0A7W6AGV3_9HYPH|nr:DUF3828 domain-containing protein [Methylobacterium brachythecii]MBB3903098.1 hypothetical protein [Methylobacterium brachythecii]GLS44678.1 hypothetical protein GCM10007884_26660 [Methylobacterium brachythecii]
MRRRLGLCLLVGASLLASAPAGAAETGSPADFLRALYAHYPLRSGKASPVTDQPKAWLAEPLLGLILRDQKTARDTGEIASLDFDPVCACQDDAGLKGVGITVQGEEAAQAKATVKFRLGGAVAVRYDLVKTDAGWRVADIHTKDVPSLAALLKDAQK